MTADLEVIAAGKFYHVLTKKAVYDANTATGPLSGKNNFTWVAGMYEGESNSDFAADIAKKQTKHGTGNVSKLRYQYWNPIAGPTAETDG